MATKSIFIDINIKKTKASRSLVNALESAQKKNAPKVVMRKRVTELKGSDIRKFFGDKK